MPTKQPTNQKLWNMVVSQAKAKYATYPSPAASHWVHEEYTRYGGKFIESSDRDRETLMERYKSMMKRKHESKHDKKHEEQKK